LGGITSSGYWPTCGGPPTMAELGSFPPAESSDQMVDVEGNVRALGQALANGKLVLVEGTGHKLHHTHSDVVMDAIDRVMEASAR
jgi:pimeloyl-ACP methyl ester carboxylesterase